MAAQLATRRPAGRPRRGLDARNRPPTWRDTVLDNVPGDLSGSHVAVGVCKPPSQRLTIEHVLLRARGLQRRHGDDVAELGGPLQAQSP